MFFGAQMNDSFNFPLGLIKYIVIVVIVCSPTRLGVWGYQEGFTSLASQKHATEDDIQEHNLQHGLHVLLQEALKELQEEQGGGPLCSGPVSAGLKGTLDILLGKMNL